MTVTVNGLFPVVNLLQCVVTDIVLFSISVVFKTTLIFH